MPTSTLALPRLIRWRSTSRAPYFYQSAIGYADNNDLGRTDLPDNSVLVRFTYYGDADLNGVVDLGDFDAWLFGYQNQSTVPHDWANGDFDYNRSIDISDFDAWLGSYQAHLENLGPLGNVQTEVTSRLTSLNGDSVDQQLLNPMSQSGTGQIEGLTN